MKRKLTKQEMNWIFYAVIIIILLFIIAAAPGVLIGLIVMAIGLVLIKLQKQGRVQLKRPRLVLVIGAVLSFLLFIVGVSSPDETKELPAPNGLLSETATTEETPPSTVEEVAVPAEDIPAPIEEPVVEKEYFKNCKELNAVYPNGVPQGHPAYDTARDRDKDGWACER